MKTNILDYLHFECPTSEQIQSLLAMAAFVKEENSDDFLVLCGAAGTGKSSIISALIGYMNDRDLSYRIAAPTGRAARIIGRKSEVLASTLHSLIYHVSTDPTTGVVTYKLKTPDDLEKTLFIIDEASMIPANHHKNEDELHRASDSLLNDLINFVKAGNPQNKIMFLGDKYQLAPINETESMALNPEYLRGNYGLIGDCWELTEVKRQVDGTSIYQDSSNIRNAIKNGQTAVDLGARRIYGFTQGANEFVSEFIQSGSESIISIGCTHNMNAIFNKNVRSRLFGDDVAKLVPGDWMLITRNWRRNGENLFNGDHVKIEEIFWADMEEVAGIKFVPVSLIAKNISGEEIKIIDYIMLDSIANPNGSLGLEMEKGLAAERHRKNGIYRDSGNAEDDKYIGAIRLTYGYAITCNKAQGGEWDKAFVNGFKIPTLNWLYTAVTRAKNQVILF